MEINMNYVKDFMLEILNIPSAGGNTKVALNRVKEEFEALGIEVKTTKKGAVIGVFEGEDNKNQKIICAHIDTLGAMVKEIKPNGRLKLSNIGGFSWNSVEGENLIIKTSKGAEYTGSLLPEKASVHIHPEEARELIRTEENMEVRIDEDIKSAEDTLRLGIKVGDFVTFETRTIVTNNANLKSVTPFYSRRRPHCQESVPCCDRSLRKAAHPHSPFPNAGFHVQAAIAPVSSRRTSGLPSIAGILLHRRELEVWAIAGIASPA